MSALTEPEFVRNARKEAAAPRDASLANVLTLSPRCTEILHVLNQILDAECAALVDDA